MTIKHNFTELFAASDPMSGIFLLLNQGNHLIFYCLLVLLFVVSMYIFQRRTQDTAKSLLYSLFIMFIISLILFYWGLSLGVVFIPEVVLLTIIVALILGLAGVYYHRSKQQ